MEVKVYKTSSIGWLFFVGCFAALLLWLVTGGCTSNQPEETSSEHTLSRDSQLPLDFEFTLYQGEDMLGASTLKLSDVLGQGKPVILNFWAALCPPCRIEMPDFQLVSEDYQQDVIFVGLDVGPLPFVRLGSSEEGQALLKELKITYPAGTTPPDAHYNASIFSAYEIVGLPSTVFLAADGTVYKTWISSLTRMQLKKLVDDLLVFSSASS